MKKEEKKVAFAKAGYRERYAMEHGVGKIVDVNGHKCICFTYSEDDEYQDANGATYDTVRKEWVN